MRFINADSLINILDQYKIPDNYLGLIPVQDIKEMIERLAQKRCTIHEPAYELALNRSYKAMTDIINERARQDERWGEQNHYPQFWMGILGEEYGELCEAVNETVFDNDTDKGGYENMRKEAVQVAAVALAFIECLDRNKEKWEL